MGIHTQMLLEGSYLYPLKISFEEVFKKLSFNVSLFL